MCSVSYNLERHENANDIKRRTFMICKKCNANNADGVKFCTSCGAELAAQQNEVLNDTQTENTQTETFEPTVEEKPKFKLDKKTIAIGVAAIVILLLIIIIIAVPKGSKNKLPEDSFIFLTDGDTTEAYVNGKVLKTKLDGAVQGSTNNLDGDEALVLTKDSSGEKKYYHVTKKNVTLITGDEVETIVMAAEGGNVYYIDGEYDLYLFNGKKSNKIDSNVGSVVASPKGSAALYTKNDERYTTEDIVLEDGEELDDDKLYMYNGKKSTELAKKYQPVALSDNRKYMYVTKTDDDSYETSLYTINSKGETNKIVAGVSNAVFNRDCSEVLFESDDNTYISIKGAEKVKLFGDDLSEILTTYTYSYSSSISLKSFVGSYLLASNDGVYKVGKKGVTTKIKSNADNPQISDDGKTLVYIKTTLTSYKLCTEKVGSDNTITISDELRSSSSFRVSSDFSYLYYIDDDDTLWYTDIKGKKKTKIADDVDSIEGMMQNDTLFFSDEDNILYSVVGKKAKTQVAADVEGFYTSGSKAYYKADSNTHDDRNTTYKFYYSKDGKKFTTLKDDVNTYWYVTVVKKDDDDDYDWDYDYGAVTDYAY